MSDPISLHRAIHLHFTLRQRRTHSECQGWSRLGLAWISLFISLTLYRSEWRDRTWNTETDSSFRANSNQDSRRGVVFAAINLHALLSGSFWHVALNISRFLQYCTLGVVAILTSMPYPCDYSSFQRFPPNFVPNEECPLVKHDESCQLLVLHCAIPRAAAQFKLEGWKVDHSPPPLPLLRSLTGQAKLDHYVNGREHRCSTCPFASFEPCQLGWLFFSPVGERACQMRRVWVVSLARPIMCLAERSKGHDENIVVSQNRILSWFL